MFIRDIETRALVDLKKTGANKYACDPDTDALCVAYAIDDEPARIWRPGEPIPKAIIEVAQDTSYPAIAHNAPFEITVERNILGPRYGWPIIPIERNICTMAMANAMALPASLGKLAKVLNLSHQKDVVGNRVMLQMTKPRRPRKGEDPELTHWFNDDIRQRQLEAYAIEDVEATREIANTLPWLSDEEHAMWVLDQQINEHGFYVDTKLAQASVEIAAQAKIIIDAEITRLTNGQATTFSQVARISEWLKQYCDIKSLNKRDILDLLEQQLPAEARSVLLLRQLGAQAAVAKAKAILNHREDDGRIRGAFVYHAAGTGRWSSRGTQMHNLKRSDTEDLDQAIGVISQADFKIANKVYENPLAVIGDLVRSMVTAAPGHTLIGADFSGIEARVTAYLAGENSKLDMFRRYDAGTGPDPYIVAAARIFRIDPVQLAADYKADKPKAREQRQIGKACELAFGFQGGINAFRRFSPGGGGSATTAQSQWEKRHGSGRSGGETKTAVANDFTDLEVAKFRDAWRAAHPHIKAFWFALQDAAKQAMRKPGAAFVVRGLITFEFDGAVLWMTLPSGRRLAYPHARISYTYSPPGTKLVVETEHSRFGYPPDIVFMDNSSGRWRLMKIYGGLLCENAVQAVARDLLAEAMVRINAAGLKIVLHVHDECVIEVAEKYIETAKLEFSKLMAQVSDWCEGLPIVVNLWQSDRFVT